MTFSTTTMDVIAQSLATLAPPPDLRPSEWAEKNVYIPAGNAVPGLIRFDNAPYQREPLNMIADPECYRITLDWAAQVGKTQVCLCAQAYWIAQDPFPQMMMQPSQSDLKKWMASKFDRMVDHSDVLKNLIAKPRGREGINNQIMKSYPGGDLTFAWAGSPTTQRGVSAPKIVCDEPDGYERSSEGHPVSLIWERSKTYGDQRTLMEACTPTFKGSSYIENAYEQGDMRQFWVPCPHCDEPQVLSWEFVKWDKDEDGEHLSDTALYCCCHCGVLWDDVERVAAIRNAEENGGGWRARKPWRGHASYHINEIYSTFGRLRDLVVSFLAKKSSGDLQTFVNTSLAETYEEQGEKADAHILMDRCEDYNAPVPRDGLVLTAGVDMQQDRLEVEVVAWGHGEESWSIDYQIFWGDPLDGDVWDQLEQYLEKPWEHESGVELRIETTCVDTGGTGGYTQSAYDWLRGKSKKRIFGIKGGSKGWGQPVVGKISRAQSGRGARKVDLFPLGVNDAKVTIMSRLNHSKVGPGYCHFPKDREQEYFEQLTAEQLVLKYSKGRPIREWKQTRPRNEALDCRVYSYAAMRIVRPDFALRDKQINGDAEIAPLEKETPQAETAPVVNPTPKPRKKRKAIKGGGWALK